MILRRRECPRCGKPRFFRTKLCGSCREELKLSARYAREKAFDIFLIRESPPFPPDAPMRKNSNKASQQRCSKG